MERPNKVYRYIFTQDNGETVRMMRYSYDFEDNYIFKAGQAKPRSNKTILDCIGYEISIPIEAWLQDVLPFEIIKVYATDIYRIPIDPDEPTVYFVPEDDNA